MEDVIHKSVMVEEVLEYLQCKKEGIYLDGTLGFGGHTEQILKASEPSGRVIALDRDIDAVEAARKRLLPFGDRITIERENFCNLKDALIKNNIEKIDGILLDLGVSSFQLDNALRGFSFRKNARLDMRMDTRDTVTAFELINESTQRELELIFRDYGEEPKARSFSRKIVKERELKPIETTVELANLILTSVPHKLRFGRTHPATRVFQALRIAVNSELENLKIGLGDGLEVLNKGGRFVVISFHSLEDRIVKNFFRDSARECICPPRIPKCVCSVEPTLKVITRKAIVAGEDEVQENPRARSAKIRVAERI